MNDLLAAGAEWLADKMQAHASQAVAYHRGADSVAGGLCATLGRTEYDVDDGHGVVIRVVAHDFLIRASDLVLAGSTVEPQRGDRIKRDVGNGVLVYEVMPAGGDDAWEMDTYRTHYRIHTKHVATE